MAALSDADRVAEWAELMRDFSRDHETCSITKANLRAAVDAADVWVDANAAAFNTALPQPARGALSAAQKSRMLTRIVRRRYETGA